jgi:hypothetical protein
MRKTRILFKQIYKFKKRFFKKIEYKGKKNRQRGRPINENILKLLLEKTGQYFIEKIKDKIQCHIADATGFAITLNEEGIEVKQIKLMQVK